MLDWTTGADLHVIHSDIILPTSCFYLPIKMITPHVQREWGKVIVVGVHINKRLWTKMFLNRTLVIDSPFQTFEVGLLVEFID